MVNPDNRSDFLAATAELGAGIEALDDGCFDHAHPVLLTLFLSPDVPCWFRERFCLPPLRELASAYLPTRASLCRMRSRAARRLSDEVPGASLLHRVLMLDAALDDRDASYRLLLHLDVMASSRLVACRDDVIAALASHGDLARARKYLGNYRDTITASAMLASQACPVRNDDSWAAPDLLAHTARYAQHIDIIQRVLRANGEDQAACHAAVFAVRLLTDGMFRRSVEREMDEPGTSLRQLLALLTPLLRPASCAFKFEASHTIGLLARRANIGANPAR